MNFHVYTLGVYDNAVFAVGRVYCVLLPYLDNVGSTLLQMSVLDIPYLVKPF